MKIGVLALQGDFSEHIVMLRRIGIESSEVRLPAVTLRLNEVNRPVRFLAWVAYPHDLGGAYFSYLDVASQAGLYVGSQELLRPRTGACGRRGSVTAGGWPKHSGRERAHRCGVGG